MNKCVTIEIPDEMHRVLCRYADLHGLDTDAYASQLIRKHVEDQRDLAIAKTHVEQVPNGN